MRIPSTTVLTALFTLVAVAVAQNGPSSEEQEMMEQMQQMRMQVMQNMQQKGIDPAELFGQVRQQMADGSFDPAAFQQSLIDRGLLTQDMVDRARETFQRTTQSSIRRQLNVTDEEWKLLEQKIQRVLRARAQLGQNGPMAGMARLFVPEGGDNSVGAAMAELRTALKDDKTPGSEIAAKLKAWREARQAAQGELDAAQKDLISVLTRRQEAVLMSIGVLQ